MLVNYIIPGKINRSSNWTATKNNVKICKQERRSLKLTEAVILILHSYICVHFFYSSLPMGIPYYEKDLFWMSRDFLE